MHIRDQDAINISLIWDRWQSFTEALKNPRSCSLPTNKKKKKGKKKPDTFPITHSNAIKQANYSHCINGHVVWANSTLPHVKQQLPVREQRNLTESWCEIGYWSTHSTTSFCTASADSWEKRMDEVGARLTFLLPWIHFTVKFSRLWVIYYSPHFHPLSLT